MSDKNNPKGTEAVGAAQDWVRTTDYEGPNRRRRPKLFHRKPKDRLDDVGAKAGPELAQSDSLETLLRRVRVWADLTHATPERRATIVAALEAIEIKAGDEYAGTVWRRLIGEVADYMRAVGAKGRLDEELVGASIQAACAAHAAGPDAGADERLMQRLRDAALAPH